MMGDGPIGEKLNIKLIIIWFKPDGHKKGIYTGTLIDIKTIFKNYKLYTQNIIGTNHKHFVLLENKFLAQNIHNHRDNGDI